MPTDLNIYGQNAIMFWIFPIVCIFPIGRLPLYMYTDIDSGIGSDMVKDIGGKLGSTTIRLECSQQYH